MVIEKQMNDNTLTVLVSGRLDTTTAPELERFLADSLDDVGHVVLDFAELEYLSSAGLRVLLATQKRMNQQGEMQLRNVNDTIMEVFEITGFLGILTIEHDAQ